jgi:hypothetical protein
VATADDLHHGDELLAKLVEADRKVGPERQRFVVSAAMGPGGVTIVHKGLSPNFRAASEQDLQDFADKGYVRLIPTRSGRLAFDVTEAAVEFVRRLELASKASDQRRESQGTSLDWPGNIFPVLEAAKRVYERDRSGLGALTADVNTELGRLADDVDVDRAIFELVQTGYLEVTLDSDQSLAPRAFRLSEKALQLTAGWPSGSGEVAFARLLATLDARIEGASSEEERGRLAKARAAITGVGRDVMIDLMSAAIQGGARATGAI